MDAAASDVAESLNLDTFLIDAATAFHLSAIARKHVGQGKCIRGARFYWVAPSVMHLQVVSTDGDSSIHEGYEQIFK